MSRLRLAFFGTPEFAVPTLERLIAGPHPVVVVVSQPDRPRGRGRRPSRSPVAAAAERSGIPLLTPERVGEPEVAERLRTFSPDLGVVVAFGQFLPKRVRELPRLGYLINAHASLLPRYRGAAPIAHAVLDGESETGVSVMRIEREMDAGPVALVKRTPIEEGEDTGTLTARLAGIAADAIEETVQRIAEGRVEWREQDHDAATLAPKLGPAEAALDFALPAEQLARRIRALAPRPGAFATVPEWQGERLRILAARALPEPCDASPGTVRIDSTGAMRIATGDGWLVPERVQRAGGRALDAASFLRGSRLSDGARLGSPSATARIDSGREGALP